MRKLTIIGILTFVTLFLYYYKTSKNFRKSIWAAFMAVFILTSEPFNAEGKGVDGFTPEQRINNPRKENFSSWATKNPHKNGSGNGDGSDGSDDGSGNALPEYCPPQSVKETKEHVENIAKYTQQIEESSDDESKKEENEEECEAEKKTVSIDIVNNKLVLRLNRGKYSTTIEENQLRKKIYHAPVFGVTLKGDLDLNYLADLNIKDRFAYVSNTDVLPIECVKDYMTQLAKHFLDPATELKVGTLGKNKVGRPGWEEPFTGIHAYNSNTKNDIFFAEKENESLMFHTAMRLNRGQRQDLMDNANIIK